MGKRFTLAEAQNLIPEASRLLREAVARKAEFDEADKAFRSLIERVTAMGGLNMDRNAALGAKARRESAAAQVGETVERIQQMGCVVKDLNIGLLDFPTLFRGVEVYLCWRLGEPSIRFWHGVDEGFANRKRIDREFRDQHRGSLEQ